MKAERDALETELKAATLDMRSQFLEALSRDGAVDEATLSTAALGRALRPLSERGERSRQRQEELVRRVREVYAVWRGEDATATGGRRTEALAALCSAHDAFHELRNNLSEGVKFYNDLTQVPSESQEGEGGLDDVDSHD